MKKDIQNKEDIKLLVDTFYGKVNEDKLIGPIFSEVAAVDWDSHLPKMYSFWESLLLGEFTYKGRPFDHHVPLPLSEKHFERWLKLFRATLDELFSGEVADMARSKAENIAGIFQFKMYSMGILQK